MTKKELEQQLELAQKELQKIKGRPSGIFGYARVSTKKQLEQNGLDAQEKEILEKYPDAKIIKEQGSGQKERPLFLELINYLQEGDTLVCVKLDRFCRSTEEGLKYIKMLLDKKVNIHILNMGMIDDTPMGKLTYTMLLAFAEFEKSLILDRMNEGKEIAMQNPNYKAGRPKKFSKEKLNLAMDLLENHTYSEVEKMTGISRGTLVREHSKRIN